MAGRPRLRQSTNVRARLSLDPNSLAEFNRALKRLESAVRRDVVEKALLAGGGVIHDVAEARAPGPYIEVAIMSGSELMKGWRSAGGQGIISNGIYAVIGPDDAHWYYRFPEFGTKAHGVKRRKRTRYQQFLRKQGVKASTARKMKTGAQQKRTVSSTRPAMVFSIDGKLIFTRKVRGTAAKPFLRPAVDASGNAAIDAVGVVLGAEILKAAHG